MKERINGIFYNTETAECIGCWESGKRNDFHYTKETLYRTKSGKFFLHGQGDQLSQYAERTGETVWTYGEKIMLMSREDAEKWIEK